MDTTTIVCIAVLVGLIVALGLVLALFPLRLRRRREALVQRFGSEYDRALEERGSKSRAERELAARAKRVQRFRLHELSEAERAGFNATWTNVQARFVDQPSKAVREANELIKDVMSARGYPVEDFEQRVADLSVDHANVVQHYRAARALVQANPEG